MAENKESFDGYLEKLAILCDAFDNLHEGKKAVVFEVDRETFVKLRSSLKNITDDENRFKIDISGIEFIYLLNE
jgi:hypothetical protein